ncbi:MAG: SDR family NAD(P)-dependent oxidoreductase, partial [Chloroflexota bacterium]
MDLGLRDRVVLITGGGGGSGPTLGRAFAAEGAVVALHHRAGSPSAARAEEAAAGIVADGGRAIAVNADLRSTDDTTAMIERVTSELGAVGVLVTATSGYASGRFTEISDDAWASTLEDALGATFRACRAVVPGMQAAGWGRIVTIAARSGLAGVARSAHYAAA